MTDPLNPLLSRRRVIQYLAVAAGTAVSLPLLARSTEKKTTTVGGPVVKSAVKYQDHPKGTSACANCANFLPGAKPDATGHCTIVSGDISPRGWCLAYASNG